MFMGNQKFKTFISVVIGFFLLIGNFNVHAWSSYTSNSEDRTELIFQSSITEDDQLPVFPPIIPISSESETDEEIGKENIDGSDSEIVNHFRYLVYPRTYVWGEIKTNHRSIFIDLPFYLLFHCWKFTASPFINLSC